MAVSWAGAGVGANGVESLFFARFGPEFLPYLYLGLGPLTFAVMMGMGVLLGRPEPTRVLVAVPLGLAAVLAGARAVLELDVRAVYPSLWLAMMVVWTVQGMTCWGLAGALNDTRQAKRLFPLFGAGLIVGGVVGGLGTGPLAGWLGVENLVLVWIAALVAMFALARSAVRTQPSRRSGRVPRRRHRGGGVVRQVGDGGRDVRRSPLLRWMALALVLFAVLYFTLALRFAETATARFPDERDLAGFLGLFMAISNAVALAVSLLVANPLFARFGVPAMVLALAAIYTAGFAVLVVAGPFLTLVAFRFVQMVWVNGVWATGWQALFNVVPPERRARVRSFMDGAPLQAGIVLSGILLLLAQRVLSARQLAVAGTVAALGAAWAMWMARRAYTGALVEALREGNPEVFRTEEEPFGGIRRDADAQAVLDAAWGDPDPTVRRIAVELAASVGGSPASVTRAIRDPDPAVRASAMRALARAEDAVPTNGSMEPMLSDPDPEVRAIAAMLFLRGGSDRSARDVLTGMAADGEPEARRAAISALAEAGEGVDLLVRGLDDPDPAVRRSAASGLARADPSRSLDPLLAALGDPDPGVRDAAAMSLVELGPVSAGGLIAALSRPEFEEGALAALVRVPEIGGEVLRSYARRQVALASHYQALCRGLGPGGDDRVELLASSVRDRALAHALRALRAVIPLRDHGGMNVALDGLTSRDGALRANAFETMEAVGEPDVVRPMVAILEATAEGQGDDGSAIRALLRDDDPWLRACSAFVASVDHPELAEELEEMAATDLDPLVREAAGTKRGGGKVETLSTLSTMERILFLRRVRLFADLSPQDLKQAAEICSERVFSDGDVIAERGEAGDEMHIVVSGEIRVVLAGQDAGEAEIARRGSGEYVGEMAIISEAPRMASLLASGDVRTLSIDRKRFERILRDRPDASLAVIRVLCDRLTETYARGAPGAQV